MNQMNGDTVKTEALEGNEYGQNLIDRGAAAYLRLPDNCTALAVATAKSAAKDCGFDDWRLCLFDACKLVSRVDRRERFAVRMGLRRAR